MVANVKYHFIFLRSNVLDKVLQLIGAYWWHNASFIHMNMIYTISMPWWETEGIQLLRESIKYHFQHVACVNIIERKLWKGDRWWDGAPTVVLQRTFSLILPNAIFAKEEQ